jgi:hypothetical protein
MKSKLYHKYHMSKYRFPTKLVQGNGTTKGSLIVGHIAALSALDKQLGRNVSVHHIEHNKGEWIFCEKR